MTVTYPWTIVRLVAGSIVTAAVYFSFMTALFLVDRFYPRLRRVGRFVFWSCVFLIAGVGAYFLECSFANVQAFWWER